MQAGALGCNCLGPCLLPDPLDGVTQNERQGCYMDHEIAADLAAGGQNKSHNFIFIDACFSGGLIEELLDSLPNVVGTTTCTRKGYGYDDAATHSGAWTHGFLMQSLVPRMNENLDLAQLFQDAHAKYVAAHSSRGDQPCFFAKSSSVLQPINTESDGQGSLLCEIALRTAYNVCQGGCL